MAQILPESTDLEKKKYKYSDENTVKEIFNKLTVIMISCVVLPVLCQNVFNMFFTHPGRQIFWEDIQSITITSFLFALMVYDACKKTKKLELTKIKKAEN